MRDEQLLIQAGYEVDSVLGFDGLIACESVADYSSILIDHACPLEDRTTVISWLKTRFPEVNILPAEWAQKYSVSGNTDLSSDADVPSEERVQATSAEPSQGDYKAAPISVGANDHSEYGSPKEVTVDFRLFYRGELPAVIPSEQRRKQQIHAIRKQFHEQLQLLWRQHHSLVGYLQPAKSSQQESIRPVFEIQADNFARCGYRFLPLVSRETGQVCYLDILVLQHEDPAGLVRAGGAIGHRVNLLLGALLMPRTCNEIESAPDADEDPFYVLMEDDSLLTDLKISEDRLLTPVTLQEQLHQVVLIIQVKSRITQLG